MSAYQTILSNLSAVASGQSDAARARANIRETIPTLFPDAPTVADIDKVKKSDAWAEFDAEARRIFAVAYFSAPRILGKGETARTIEADPANLRLWTATKKEAAAFTPDETDTRKGAQAYVRVSVKQNITDFIPAATDAPAEEGEEGEELPDPTATLALVTEALTILSEKDNKAALALLNGLDALVKAARPFISAGNPLPRKA